MVATRQWGGRPRGKRPSALLTYVHPGSRKVGRGCSSSASSGAGEGQDSSDSSGLEAGEPCMTAPATEGLDTLIVGPAALVAALSCYAAWRLRPRPGLAFATIGLTVLGFQDIAR